MKCRTLLRAITCVAAFALLSACGGGGGATFGGGISGTGKPGFRFGDVDTTTGVTVGGTTFETAAAVVTIDGASSASLDVRDGHVALVEGLIDGASGVADAITIESAVCGLLTAKLDANRLAVQGQTIQLDEDTLYDDDIVPASMAGLVVGDVLKIYGFVKGPGLILATRVERASGSELRLVGVAENVDAALDTFTLGTQTIDYATADVSDLPGGDPVNGQLVEVRGSAVLGPSGEIVATRVEGEDFGEQPDNDETEVEGYVTAVIAPGEFRIGAVTVRTNGATVFRGGLATDIVVGVRVEVEGAFASGILTAREVKFGESIELESDVATVVGETITLVGLPGITVGVSSLTEIVGDAETLSEILPGDHVRIRGRKTGSSSVAASRVEETDADTDIQIQGPVDSSPTPQDPSLSILGVLINTSGIAEGGFESPENEVIGRAGFFAAAVPGTLVKIEGELSGGVPVWEEAELEGDDD